MLARIVPLMLCHAQLMAQGTTAMGLAATKKVMARLVPRPAFCMPTSMASVFFFANEKWKRRPTLYPRR